MLTLQFFIVCNLGFLLACQGQTFDNSRERYIDETISIDQKNIPKDSGQFYFPLELFRDTALYVGHDTFVVSWYSEHLFAMREPLLFNKKDDNEIFRFIWLRTFHHPVAIRIEKNNDDYRIYWKVCSGVGGYEPGDLTIDEEKPIDKQDWDKFQNLLTAINYWNLTTNEKEILGEDGSQWILEGATTDKYHVVDRWTPNEEGQFYKACDFLLSLTNLEIKKRDKY